ncbi:uncharacterized protein PRCAT00004743001 [Priceomyces carsonii]|uniref:uncharacterized protein n=1 Tax=Priceomyces carsonii TaxID=28549 RepID=UPI002EDB97F7|nr:unnamed protein product [Priceomyces carsonii]
MKLTTIIQVMRYRGAVAECNNFKGFKNRSEIFYWKKFWITVLFLSSSLCFDAGMTTLVSKEELEILLNLEGDRSTINEVSSIRLLSLKIYTIKVTNSLIQMSQKLEVKASLKAVYNLIDDYNFLLRSMRTFEELLDGSYDVNEQIEEFRLRADILVKLFLTHFKLSLILKDEADKALKIEHDMLAFVHGLTILKLGLELSTRTDDSVLRCSVASSILHALLKSIFIIVSIYFRIYDGIISGLDLMNFIQKSTCSSLIFWLGVSSEVMNENQIITLLNEKLWRIYIELGKKESDYYCRKTHYMMKVYIIPYIVRKYDFSIFQQEEMTLNLPISPLSFDFVQADFPLLWDDYFGG